MNMVRRILLPSALIFSLLLAACTPDSAGSETVDSTEVPVVTEVPPTVEPTLPPPTEEPETNPAAELNGTSWQLTGFGPNGGPLPDGLDVNITLNIEDGAINGNGGCNSYFGEISFATESVTIPLVGSTEMACFPENVMTFETMYHQALTSSTSWSLDGEALTLTGPESKLIFIRLMLNEASQLEGTSWSFNGLGTGEGDSGSVSSPLANSSASLLLQAGAISGDSSCNNYTGTYSLDGDKITVSPLASTRKACENAVMEQETSIQNGLMNATNWEIDGDNLTIYFPGGFLLFKAQA